MADESRELEIKITTTADVGGVKQAEEAIKGVTSAAGAAAHGSGQLGNEVKELGHHFHEAAGAGRVVAEVLHGNIGAIGHLGVAVKTIGTLLKTNLIGTLVTLGAVAAQVILPIIQGFDETKKKIEEAAKASEKLGKANMDSLARGLGVAGEAADELRKKFDAANASKERLDNAEKAARLAEVRANTKLSEVEKAKAEFSINEEFRVRDEGRKIQAEKDKITIAEHNLKAANEDAAGPQRDLEAAIKSNNRAKELDEKFKERDKLRRVVTAGEAPAEDKLRLLKLNEELENADRPTKESLAQANDRVEKRNEEANAAQRRIAAAESGVRDTRFGLTNEQKIQARQREFTQREQAADLKGALNAASAKDLEKVGGVRSAQGAVEQAATNHARLQQELAQLEDQQQRRTGLSSDPANKDIADAIAKKKEDLSAAAGQITAARSASELLKKNTAPSIVADAQKPALDAVVQLSANEKAVTAAVLKLVGALDKTTAALTAAKPTEQPGEAQPGDAAARPGSRGGGSVNGVPVAEAIAALNSGSGVIRKDSTELAEAHKKFADEVLQSRQDLKASLDRSRQQAANQREQGPQ